jgi:cation-transporting P-type ATPase 13A2
MPCTTQLVRYFEHRHLRYLFDHRSERFCLFAGLEQRHSFERLHRLARMDSAERASRTLRLALHGRNNIDVEVKGYLYLLVKEVLHPFFLFQILAIGLWTYEQYYYYAGCIFFVSAVSITISLVETRRNLVRLREMVLFRGTVTRLTTPLDAPELTETVSSEDLLPGDVIVIPPEGMVMSCDAVLLTSGCVVNESMLTGASDDARR